MLGIQGLLKKYLDFTPPERAQVRAVTQALAACLDILVPENAVVIRNGKAYITVDTIQKSEIALHKKRVLQKTESILGTSSIVDIA